MFSYSQYDLLMMFSNYGYSKQTVINQNHLFLFVTKKQLEFKMEQIKRLKAEGKIKKDEEYKIVAINLKNSTSQLVLDYKAIKQKKNDNKQYDQVDYENYNLVEKKEFKYPSLAVLGDKLPALKSARTTIEFDDLGVETMHLDYFRNLNWRHNIKELKLTNNKIEDITILLDNLNCLQRFYFNDNYVKELRFNKPLPNLEILNGTHNLINSIHGLSSISQIRKLLLGSNKLKEFPKCKDLKVLNILNLKENYLQNVSNILETDFPELQQLIISGQLAQYDQNNYEEEQKSSQDNNKGLFGYIWGKKEKDKSMVIEYPKLKNFESQRNQMLFLGTQISFQSDSLQKISLNNCSIDTIIFNRRQCLQNLKYLHLSDNKIKYFSFLSATQPRNYRRLRDSSVSNDTQIENKPISNDSLVELILSYNEIQYLPVMRFSSLRRLHLQNNQIKDIRPLQKSKIPELEFLNLGGNPFTSICPLYFTKLTELNLQDMNQLNDVNTIFKGPSQLPSLQIISFGNCQKTDFSFNLNGDTNNLTKLKKLNFYNVDFQKAGDKEGTKFDISTLQVLVLNQCIFNHFPLLVLPKLKQLDIPGAYAESYKNLQTSKLPQLIVLSLTDVKQSMIGVQDFIQKQNTDQNGQKQPPSKTVVMSRCLTCNFPFPKLKQLTLVSCNIGSLTGLQNYKYSQLEYIRLSFISTLDNKLPKLKAPNLTEIQITSFKLPNADTFLDNTFPKLAILCLEDNEIQTIGDKTLAGLTQIKSLSLARNKIKKFVCSKNLDKLTILDLTSNEMTSFPRIKAKNLTDIKWDNNNFTDLSELQNCELPALESMEFYFCNFKKSGLPKLNMPGLQSLNIAGSKLSDLSNLSKSKLPALRQLTLNDNEIVNFPVVDLPQLEELNLENNKIKDVQFLKKSKLHGLNNLNLSKNNLSRLPPQLQLSHLKNFYCNNMNLGTLPILDFPQIQDLCINFAQLTDISEFAKGEYKSLKYLNLSNNKIRILPRVYMESLQTFVIDGNEIEDLSDFFESDLPVMQMNWISFEKNKITKVPNLLFGNVEFIRFNQNPLTDFTPLTLLEYPKLACLCLNHTQIKNIKLPKLPKLEKLQLGNSKIEDLNWLVNFGQNYPNLIKLDVRGSKITRVPNLDQVKSLSEVYLSGNPIKNVDGLISSKMFSSISCIYIDLDVGDDFEKMKKKITEKNPLAIVGNYELQQPSQNKS